ncbi:MAG: FixH family protein [Acetobacteraceae bacterium]
MRLRDGLAAVHGPGPGRGAAWQWFPWAVVAAMGVVVAVNIAMVSFALHTFPGQAGSDGFDLSNHYDQVLEKVQRDAALGWVVRLLPGDAGHPVLVLTDRSGAPLRDAQVQATAERPLGPPETTHLVFRAEGAGRYVADAALTMPGQWELQLSASAQGHTIAATRRIVVVSTPLPLKRERSAQSAG